MEAKQSLHTYTILKGMNDCGTLATAIVLANCDALTSGISFGPCQPPYIPGPALTRSLKTFFMRVTGSVNSPQMSVNVNNCFSFRVTWNSNI